MGLRLRMVSMPFARLIPALRKEKIDLIVSALSDTAERRKLISFVDYAPTTETLLVRRTTTLGTVPPFHYHGLCGHSVVVTAGSVEDSLLRSANTGCGTAIRILSYATSGAAGEAFLSGQGEAYLADLAVAGYYFAHHPGSFYILWPPE
jgi:polar amino acid transport system substrate-binding protein